MAAADSWLKMACMCSLVVLQVRSLHRISLGHSEGIASLSPLKVLEEPSLPSPVTHGLLSQPLPPAYCSSLVSLRLSRTWDCAEGREEGGGDRKPTWIT